MCYKEIPCSTTYILPTLRKHRCPIHHSNTSNLVTHQPANESYNPKSDYQDQFKPVETMAAKRSLKVPPRILPDLPKKKMELVSVNHLDFVPHSLSEKPTRYKPVDKPFSSDAEFDAQTSYRIEYPLRDLQPNLPAPTLMRTTIPMKLESEVYATTNQTLLRKWRGNHRPPAFHELPQKPMFEGEFFGQSVFQKDFNPKIAAMGRPRTTLKKVEKTQQSNAKFEGSTTVKSAYKLPKIVQREKPHLRSMGLKHVETMMKPVGSIQKTTQYRMDHPALETLPPKRDICPPKRDSLQLFAGGKLSTQTEHQASYTKWKEQPKPSAPFKRSDKAVASESNFDGTTSNMVQFQPVPVERQVANLKEVDQKAAQVGFDQKNGRQMKEAQNFGGHFAAVSTNQYDYFQFKKTKPRIRYIDQSEKAYKPSSAKFDSLSEFKTSFIPLDAKALVSFKPLDQRIQTQHPLAPERVPLLTSTAYKEEYPPRPLPTRSACPAERLLQQVCN